MGGKIVQTIDEMIKEWEAGKGDGVDHAEVAYRRGVVHGACGASSAVAAGLDVAAINAWIDRLQKWREDAATGRPEDCDDAPDWRSPRGGSETSSQDDA